MRTRSTGRSCWLERPQLTFTPYFAFQYVSEFADSVFKNDKVRACRLHLLRYIYHSTAPSALSLKLYFLPSLFVPPALSLPLPLRCGVEPNPTLSSPWPCYLPTVYLTPTLSLPLLPSASRPPSFAGSLCLPNEATVQLAGSAGPHTLMWKASQARQRIVAEPSEHVVQLLRA